MKLSIDFNAVGVRRYLSNVSDQAHFAMAVALTRTGQNVKAEEASQMSRYFDRPTPYAQNSLFLKPATKQNLVAIVDVKNVFGADARFMRPQIYGGARNRKGSEKALAYFRSALGLPADIFIVPGGAAPLDKYGNIPGGIMKQILSVLKASEATAGYQSDITAASKKRNKKPRAYFIARIHGTLGVWERKSNFGPGMIRPILIFVKQPKYNKRLPFFEIAQTVFDREIKGQFNLAFAAAIESIKVPA
jgi:hypothetical protein